MQNAEIWLSFSPVSFQTPKQREALKKKNLSGDKDDGQIKSGDFDAKVIFLQDFTKVKMPLKHLSVAFRVLLKVLIYEHETSFPKSQAGLQIMTKPFNPV